MAEELLGPGAHNWHVMPQTYWLVAADGRPTCRRVAKTEAFPFDDVAADPAAFAYAFGLSPAALRGRGVAWLARRLVAALARAYVAVATSDWAGVSRAHHNSKSTQRSALAS